MERNQIQTYLNSNKERFLNELLDLLKIPSISAKPDHKADMERTDEAVKQRLIEAGEINGVKVLDHIIIGDDYLSFVSQGLWGGNGLLRSMCTSVSLWFLDVEELFKIR